jgi:hypothetical protein
MFRQFKFEEALYEKLDHIPVSTQYKLESLGLRFPRAAWSQLVLPERWVFCHLPIRSKGERECYSQYLSYVLNRDKMLAAVPRDSKPEPIKKGWEDISRLPSEVAQKMRDLNLPLFWPEWIKMDDMERYALFKLCQENAEESQIRQAVQEFLGFPSLSSTVA